MDAGGEVVALVGHDCFCSRAGADKTAGGQRFALARQVVHEGSDGSGRVAEDGCPRGVADKLAVAFHHDPQQA